METLFKRLTFDMEETGSIVQAITFARENARNVRELISSEMWTQINRLYLSITQANPDEIWNDQPHTFYKDIIEGVYLFQGITDGTMNHSQGWHFIQTGFFLERADKTSRILDIPHRLAPLNYTPSWGAVLGSCSARSAYRERYGNNVTESGVTDLLIFSDAFPRSIRFCIRHVDENLHAISGTPRGQFSNEVERLAGATVAQLDFAGQC